MIETLRLIFGILYLLTYFFFPNDFLKTLFLFIFLVLILIELLICKKGLMKIYFIIKKCTSIMLNIIKFTATTFKTTIIKIFKYISAMSVKDKIGNIQLVLGSVFGVLLFSTRPLYMWFIGIVFAINLILSVFINKKDDTSITKYHILKNILRITISSIIIIFALGEITLLI